MKAKALQFGKAISAALFVLLLVVVGSKNALAQTQVATLQHGDDISAFYGTNAFVEAHTAAQTGDIITLSSGTFVPCDITKAITLRGAGCAVDTVANINPTIFGGSIFLNVADTVNFLTIEGILFTNDVHYSTLYNPKFNRCNFSNIENSGNMRNAQLVNCIINKIDFYNTPNIVLLNSVVWNADGINSSSVVLYNSILADSDLQYSFLSAYNSIIIKYGAISNSSYHPKSSCSFINCIGINTTNTYNTFGAGYTSGCINYTSYEEVFESFAGEFSLDEPFILKDEIATGFLGNDGTQVGIYGGYLPYSNRPSYMVLKRCNVANKSTIDGKLSVEIEVVNEE
jgi:uncharacterized protein YjbI with pentapeptide repeats